MNRESKPIGLNVGSASIIMIFAVLCLTVFSALSLVTAVSEKSTAEKYAASTSSYYQADYQAEIIRTKIADSLSYDGSADAAATAGTKTAAAFGADMGVGAGSDTDKKTQTADGTDVENVTVKTMVSGNTDIYTYSIPLADGISQLSVVLADEVGEGVSGAVAEEINSDISGGNITASGKRLKVLCWEKTNIADWSPDQYIQVWDFGEGSGQ